MAKLHVRQRSVRMVEILKEVHDRRVLVQFLQEQRRAKTGVTDNQVRLDIQPALQSPIHAIAMPDGILKSASAKVALLCRTTANAVDHLPYAILNVRHLRVSHERAFPPHARDEVSSDMPELGRVILMDVKNMHGCTTS